MIYKHSPKKNPLCEKKIPPLREGKKIYRKEGKTPRLSPPLCASPALRLCVKKIRRGGAEILRDKQQRRGAAKKEIPLRLPFFAPLREPTFFQKINRRYRRDRLVPTKTIPVPPVHHQSPEALLSR